MKNLINATTDLALTIKEVNEKLRLKKLSAYKILDTVPERAFDDIASLASYICDTPIAAITFIDENRQWIKALYGNIAREIPRKDAFCDVTIQGDQLIVEDASRDELFKSNVLVLGEPNIRFYAGITLVTQTGEPLGALCVIDQKPRTLDENQLLNLQKLSKIVLELLEFRLKVNSLTV